MGPLFRRLSQHQKAIPVWSHVISQPAHHPRGEHRPFRYADG